MYQEINSDIVQMYDESYYYFIRPRTFYSMGSGTPVICEKHEEIKRFFSDGDNIILWDGDNILEKINYYLNNKNKLMELGLAGMETVRSFHTTEYRIKNIIIPALLGEL